MLYIIGLGLNDEKDLTLKGLEAIKKCDKVFLESYTSVLQTNVKELEKLYGKKIILAHRELVEQKSGEILKDAKKKNVAFLVIGDPFGATTHIDLVNQAKEKKIDVKIIHNASVLTAVGETGLQLYNFGKVVSIPFHKSKSHMDGILTNLKNGMHTLVLLDLDPLNNKFMTIKEACDRLNLPENTKIIGCARLGSDTQKIAYGEISKIKTIEFGSSPCCIIVPGKLHFTEEEFLKQFIA
ncbi:MAG: diphthine synthase [Candidatus Woesearchaeota archaeon]